MGRTVAPSPRRRQGVAQPARYDFIDGYARQVGDVLSHGLFFGFTGTLIELQDANTRAVFTPCCSCVKRFRGLIEAPIRADNDRSAWLPTKSHLPDSERGGCSGISLTVVGKSANIAAGWTTENEANAAGILAHACAKSL